MNYTTKQLEASLKEEYKMNCRCYVYSTDVAFFGSELECYRLAYILKDKKTNVEFSKSVNSWVVTIDDFFTVEFAEFINA